MEDKTKIKFSAAESMEDMADIQENRIVKRRLMLMEEASVNNSEVRRLHIVYFLSRKGRIEHPHLVRVHHHSRNGVRLRDVKRWLGELRGKDMPQLYAWSYKRKYKTGYVWQDLLDDDLITPISNNEFVLKGSEISSNATNKDFSYSDKQLLIKKDEASIGSETSMFMATKSSSEIEEESVVFGSETSTVTDDNVKLETENSSEKTKQEKKQEAEEKIENPFYSTLLSKKTKSKGDKVKTKNETNNTSPSSTENSNKSKSQNPNNIFRNLITCGAVDTNDSAVVAMNKRNNSRPLMSMCSGDDKNVKSSAEICKREKFGGSQRILGNPTWTQQHWSGRKSCDGGKGSTKSKSSEFREQRALYAAAYKPVNGPNCSQCAKQFKPEKLHSHMKSCKGIKALSKAAATVATPAIVIPTSETTLQQQSTNSQNENLDSGNLLAQ